MITLIYRHWRPRNLPNYVSFKHHPKKFHPVWSPKTPTQKRHDEKTPRHLLNKVMQFASQLRQRLGTGPLSHLKLKRGLVFMLFHVTFWWCMHLIHLVPPLRELACRPISWGSWLTLSEYNWGVQSPPKCKVFRFHETIPEKVIDWIPLGIRCEEKEDLGPKTVLRQG